MPNNSIKTINKAIIAHLENSDKHLTDFIRLEIAEYLSRPAAIEENEEKKEKEKEKENITRITDFVTSSLEEKRIQVINQTKNYLPDSTSISYTNRMVCGIAAPFVTSYSTDFVENTIENIFASTLSFSANQLTRHLHPMAGPVFTFFAKPSMLALAGATFSSIKPSIKHSIEEIVAPIVDPRAIAFSHGWIQGESALCTLAKTNSKRLAATVENYNPLNQDPSYLQNKPGYLELGMRKFAWMTVNYTGNFFSSTITYGIQFATPLAIGAVGYGLNSAFPKSTIISYLTASPLVTYAVINTAKSALNNAVVGKKLSYIMVLQCCRLLGYGLNKISDRLSADQSATEELLPILLTLAITVKLGVDREKTPAQCTKEYCEKLEKIIEKVQTLEAFKHYQDLPIAKAIAREIQFATPTPLKQKSLYYLTLIALLIKEEEPENQNLFLHALRAALLHSKPIFYSREHARKKEVPDTLPPSSTFLRYLSMAR